MASEIGQRFSEINRERVAVLEKLTQVCRAVVPILRDKDLKHTADMMEALLSSLEALDVRMELLATEDPQATIRYMQQSLRRE